MQPKKQPISTPLANSTPAPKPYQAHMKPQNIPTTVFQPVQPTPTASKSNKNMMTPAVAQMLKPQSSNILQPAKKESSTDFGDFGSFSTSNDDFGSFTSAGNGFGNFQSPNDLARPTRTASPSLRPGRPNSPWILNNNQSSK